MTDAVMQFLTRNEYSREPFSKLVAEDPHLRSVLQRMNPDDIVSQFFRNNKTSELRLQTLLRRNPAVLPRATETSRDLDLIREMTSIQAEIAYLTGRMEEQEKELAEIKAKLRKIA